MNNNTKILLVSIALGLFWSSPALRAISTGGSSMLEIWLSVLIRVLVVFGVLKFIISVASKTKK